jgi:hypothetical protein
MSAEPFANVQRDVALDQALDHLSKAVAHLRMARDFARDDPGPGHAMFGWTGDQLAGQWQALRDLRRALTAQG